MCRLNDVGRLARSSFQPDFDSAGCTIGQLEQGTVWVHNETCVDRNGRWSIGSSCKTRRGCSGREGRNFRMWCGRGDMDPFPLFSLFFPVLVPFFCKNPQNASLSQLILQPVDGVYRNPASCPSLHLTSVRIVAYLCTSPVVLVVN